MDDLIRNNDDLLIDYPSYLRTNIQELCTDGKVGLIPINIDDINKIQHQISHANKFDEFHFIIKVPYAGKRLSWQLIFNPEDNKFPCDFDYNDEVFMDYLSLEIIEEHVPSLMSWSLENPTTLTKTLNELLLLYKRYQIEKLKNDNIYARFHKEYETLMDKEQTEVKEVEVYVEKNVIHFLISVNIDCTHLPEYIQPFGNENYVQYVNPGWNYAHIYISYRKLDGSDYQSAIELSPHVKQLFDTLPKFKVTPYKGTPIPQYIEQVQKFFNEKIADLVEQYEVKKQYILYLAAICAENLIEFDAITYSSCSFIYDHDSYECMVRVTVNHKFPKEKPVVTIYPSECVRTQPEVCSKTVEGYNFAMNDEVDEMVINLTECLPQNINKFKEHKH